MHTHDITSRLYIAISSPSAPCRSYTINSLPLMALHPLLIAFHFFVVTLPAPIHTQCPITKCSLGFISGIRWDMLLGSDSIAQWTAEWISSVDRLVSGGMEYREWDDRVSQNIKVSNLGEMVNKLKCHEEMKNGSPGCSDVYDGSISQFVSNIQSGWCRLCRGFIPKMQAHRNSVNGRTKPIPKADIVCQPKLVSGADSPYQLQRCRSFSIYASSN